MTFITPSPPTITLRPIRPEDEPFLAAVYASTREAELAQVEWSAEQKNAFLQMQFTLQHRHHREQFPGAQFAIVVVDGRDVGRLYVDRRDDEIRIVDLSLLPEHRGAGLGTRLLGDLIAEARRSGTPVRIHVERPNPALRLYERLGFSKVGGTDVHYLMEWSPEGAPT